MLKENNSRFSLAIRIISAILVVAFFAQDIAWAHPDKLQIELNTSRPDFKGKFNKEYEERSDGKAQPAGKTISAAQRLHEDTNGKANLGAIAKLWHSRKVRLVVISAAVVMIGVLAFREILYLFTLILISAWSILVITNVYDHIKWKIKGDRDGGYADPSRIARHRATLYFLLSLASLPGPLTREDLFRDLGFYNRPYFGNIGFDRSLGDALSFGVIVFGVLAIWYFVSYVKARIDMSSSAQSAGAAESGVTGPESVAPADHADSLMAARRAMWLRIAFGAITLAVFLGFNYIAGNLAQAGSLPFEWAVAYTNIIHPSTWLILYLSIIFFNSAFSYYLDYRRLQNDTDGGHFNEPPSRAPPQAPPEGSATVSGPIPDVPLIAAPGDSSDRQPTQAKADQPVLSAPAAAKVAIINDYASALDADIQNTINLRTALTELYEIDAEKVTYIIRLNNTRISSEYIGLITKYYTDILSSDKVEVRVVGNREMKNLIEVEIKKREKKEGEGAVDIKAGEGQIESLGRLVGMVNLAISVATLPDESPNLNTGAYEGIMRIISIQYQSLTGDKSPLPSNPKDIREKMLNLPPAEAYGTKSQEDFELMKKELSIAA